MLSYLKTLWRASVLPNIVRDQKGQDLIEYAVLLVFISLAAILLLSTAGIEDRLEEIFQDIADAIGAVADET